MDWTQIYDPFGSAWISSLVAAMPIVLLLGLLALGVSAPRSAAVSLAAALAASVFGFGMPGDAAVAAAANGACFGLFPIGWIVFNAVLLYQLTVRSGQFDIVKRSVTAISPDRRIQALLIAFCFGTFLEGAAGFGTPVAISAALLIGIGFSPLYAAGLTLIANTSPVAFGALGTPIITLAKFSGLDEMALSQMAGRQLPLFSLIVPAWLVAVMSGWKGVKGCWPAIVVCGGSFATIQFIMSNWHGPTLVDVLGGVGALVILTLFLRFWQPKEIWRFPEEKEEEPSDATSASDGTARPLTARQVAYAWTPWAVLSVMVFVWGCPTSKLLLDGDVQTAAGAGQHVAPGDPPASVPALWRPFRALQGRTKLTFEVPRLHNRVYRAAPVVPVPEGADRAELPEKATYDFNWLSSTGTSIFLAAVVSAFWLRIGLGGFVAEFLRTLYRVRWALATIACMLALALLTKFSGMDATLGLAFTHSGWLYPFFAPLLGWLGVALTGSDTSSNALFGSLQRITTEQLNRTLDLNLNPVLIVASNSTGGVMGKMIDAQSIVVAAVATGQSGSEGRI
ncbi:MAG: lactate permease LctP family transporter, partial [Pirellulales bacterium]|nr:lactate permease LctP family transporter [Pirellulales bacterium]